MMNLETASPRSKNLCTCGCENCSGQCCELECLVQPRFYCGQLLTDQDLTVLLDWTKGKTGLARYRHGWGIVCGLEVQCQTTSGSGPALKVTPGYAIDCCGNDIVVCADATLDLSSCCKPKPQPCADPVQRPPPPPADTVTVKFGGWELPNSDVQAIDVSIRYAEFRRIRARVWHAADAAPLQAASARGPKKSTSWTAFPLTIAPTRRQRTRSTGTTVIGTV